MVDGDETIVHLSRNTDDNRSASDRIHLAPNADQCSRDFRYSSFRCRESSIYASTPVQSLAEAVSAFSHRDLSTNSFWEKMGDLWMIQKIFIQTPEWQLTFPHRVAPLADEWLPGLLLRCDVANQWSSGMTMTHLIRSIGGSLLRGGKGKPSWIVVPLPALEYMAQVLSIPESMLLATTYQAELAGLYAPTSPHAKQLSARRSFHLCPVCIAETHLLRRRLILHHISICPYHQVVLANACQCGAALQLFSQQMPPFACHECGWEWARLPLLPALPEHFHREQKVLSCYEFFFAQGTPQLIAHVLHLTREKLKKERIVRVKLLDGTVKQVEHYELTRASLGYLVDLLVSLEGAIQTLLPPGVG
jgi:TniQ